MNVPTLTHTHTHTHTHSWRIKRWFNLQKTAVCTVKNILWRGLRPSAVVVPSLWKVGALVAAVCLPVWPVKLLANATNGPTKFTHW